MSDIEHRLEWRKRMTEWLVPRLKGGAEDVMQFLDLFNAAMNEAHSEGCDDAAYIAKHLADASPQSRELAIVSDALDELVRRNRMDAP